MQQSASLLETNRIQGHLLREVFAITDGGRMPYANYFDTDLQNSYDAKQYLVNWTVFWDLGAARRIGKVRNEFP